MSWKLVAKFNHSLSSTLLNHQRCIKLFPPKYWNHLWTLNLVWIFFYLCNCELFRNILRRLNNNFGVVWRQFEVKFHIEILRLNMTTVYIPLYIYMYIGKYAWKYIFDRKMYIMYIHKKNCVWYAIIYMIYIHDIYCWGDVFLVDFRYESLFQTSPNHLKFVLKLYMTSSGYYNKF